MWLAFRSRCEGEAVQHRVCRHFFFSSRRRHTRCSRDWSSDVCSSDLRSRSRTIDPGAEPMTLVKTPGEYLRFPTPEEMQALESAARRARAKAIGRLFKIGRASCRERV